VLEPSQLGGPPSLFSDLSGIRQCCRVLTILLWALAQPAALLPRAQAKIHRSQFCCSRLDHQTPILPAGILELGLHHSTPSGIWPIELLHNRILPAARTFGPEDEQ
jgi:hypothetical protein